MNKKSFLFILTTLLTPILSFSQQINNNKKVIVIGAGISGLSAANHLKKQRVDVLILEAQEKIGGRIKTNRSLDIPFDEGASWIHGPEDNPITEIANKANAETFVTKDDSTSVFNLNGKKYTDAALEKAEQKYYEVLNDLKGSKKKSFKEVFNSSYPEYQKDHLWTYMLSAYLEFDIGGDINKLSSKDFYNDEEFSGEDVIITNGYDNITNHLADGIDVKLNTIVNSIDYSENSVSINTTKGLFYSDCVIITVPLGVLKNNRIVFNPPLPKRINKAINKLEMGSVNKFLLVWDKPFWDTNLQYIGYTPETKGKFNYFLNLKKFTDKNALMTFTFGDYSVTSENKSDTKIIDEIMTHLRTIYGKETPKPTQMLRTKWNTNPFTYGSYSFATNGSRSNQFKKFTRPIKKKLFFAGEHTSKEYRGTVHGAYLSGIRAAKQLINKL